MFSTSVKSGSFQRGWRTGGIFVSMIAAIVPMVAAAGGVYMLGWADEVYADRQLPALTAWVFEHRWIVALMLLPATLCGVFAAFARRPYLIYGPYLVLLMAPLFLMIAAFAWLIITIYAAEIESAL
jgi:hypothetical protein